MPRRGALFGPVSWLLLGLAAVTGCSPAEEEPGPEDEAASALAGVEVKLVVVGDPALAEAVKLLRGEWQGSTGAKLEISEQTVEELLTQKEPSADALIYPAQYLGELAERGWIALIPEATLNDQEFQWQEIFEADKSRIAAWGTEAYGIPFGSAPLTCCYRADLLEKLQRKPPETWTEYHELARLLADRKNLGKAAPPDDATWFAAAEPLAERWAGLTLLARAAAYAKHPNHYSALFDMQSMEPLVAGPPFVRALDELAAAAKLSGSSPLNPSEVRQALASGQCALALTWPAPARARQSADDGESEQGEKTAAKLEIGFCELPGADQVYNVGAKSWDKRPKGKYLGVPLMGAAGRIGSIAKKAAAPEAAGQLLAWLSGPKWGARVSTASTETTLYRESQLVAPAEWVGLPVEESAALQYAESVQRAMTREESLIAPRIPGRDRYLAALDAAVQKVVAGEATSQEALDQAAAQWRKITEELGLEAQREAYHRDLGLR